MQRNLTSKLSNNVVIMKTSSQQRTPKQNWFETLNAALESENLVEFWELGLNIGYGEIVRHHAETEKGVLLISVTRENDGRYERPVHYYC